MSQYTVTILFKNLEYQSEHNHNYLQAEGSEQKSNK